MERYTRVFSLPENLYTENAPLLIAAGALLKDNETQRVLAQLKFRNITKDRIKAVKVSVTPFDTVGNPLGEAIEYQYLDLSAARDEEFGQKKPLYLPNETTRSFSVQVTQVIFEDNTIWDSAGAWDALPEQEPLSSALPGELLEQYHINFGQDKRFVPNQTADLWRCGCGAINRQEETLCHNCQSDFSVLTNGLDREVLSEQRKKRLAEEAQREDEKKVKKQEKAKKTKKIVIPVTAIAIIAIIVIMCAFVVPKCIIPAIQQSADYEEVKELELKPLQQDVQKKSQFISAGYLYTVGLKSDGTVVAVGSNDDGNCNISGWSDIVAVSAGGDYTVALKSDGTVVAVGNNEYGQCDVRSWKDIVAVSAGILHTVGQKSDGTVVAAGTNECGQCNVSDWNDIVAVSAGTQHTVGLKSDGTVVAVGDNEYDQCDVSGWNDIVAISAGAWHTVGLKSDGTVVAVGDNDDGKRNISGWRDIIEISAGCTNTVGLKSDGTVVVVGNNSFDQCDVSSWNNIVAVSAGDFHTVGLKSDGTVVAVGYNGFGQCDVNGWRGIGIS